METTEASTAHGSTSPKLNSFAWIAANPFGDSTPFLLLTPGDKKAAEQLEEFAKALGLLSVGPGVEMPRVGANFLSVALRGPFADLGTENRSWLKVPVSDHWTAAAISRRYTVLAVGANITGDQLENEDISRYLQSNPPVQAGLVTIRVRVTEE